MNSKGTVAVLAAQLYRTVCERVGGRGELGQLLRPFEWLSDGERAAWEAVAEVVLKAGAHVASFRGWLRLELDEAALLAAVCQGSTTGDSPADRAALLQLLRKIAVLPLDRLRRRWSL